MGLQKTRWHRNGPLDVEILRTGILLSGHEDRHILGGPDDIDASLDGRAIALTTQGDIVYLSGVANTLARLAAGVAGQALLTGGAGANPSWGAPTPAAHEDTHIKGGSDDIDSALDSRAIAITTHGDIVFGDAVANTLERLTAGVAGQALLTGGAGADPSWGAPAPAVHGIAKHTDRTSHLSVDPREGGGSGGPDTIYNSSVPWGTIKLSDASDQYCSFAFKVPHDYVSDPEFKVYVIARAAGNIYSRAYAAYCAVGQLNTTHEEVGNSVAQTLAQWEVEEIDLRDSDADIFANLAIDDIVNVTFRRFATDDLDTISAQVDVVLGVFYYTADQ